MHFSIASSKRPRRFQSYNTLAMYKGLQTQTSVTNPPFDMCHFHANPHTCADPKCELVGTRARS